MTGTVAVLGAGVNERSSENRQEIRVVNCYDARGLVITPQCLDCYKCQHYAYPTRMMNRDDGPSLLWPMMTVHFCHSRCNTNDSTSLLWHDRKDHGALRR